MRYAVYSTCSIDTHATVSNAISGTQNSSPRNFSYPRTARIRKRPEILKLQESGRKAYSKHFLLIVSENAHDTSRLAITVTRKVDKRAVKRNQLKRRVREIFRLNRHRFRQNFDILIIARKNACQISYAEITREVMGALHHKGFLRVKKQRENEQEERK